MKSEQTWPSIRRDFVEWHLGRKPYVFWALDVDTPTVVERVACYVRLLGASLLYGYERQPHVTLEVCGFPAPRPSRDDEFDGALLRAQLAALRRARPRPFSITVAGPDSFLSAPYIAVLDGAGGIAALRSCLAINGQHRLLGDYVPHVTIGLYAHAELFAAIRQRLMACRCGDDLSLPVERLSLMSYAPADIGGALQCLGEYRLATGEWGWFDSSSANGLEFLRDGMLEA